MKPSFLRPFALLAALIVALMVPVQAASLRVGTLNAALCFDPQIDHAGKVDDESRMTVAQYRTKIANLATMVRGLDFVGLQEVGGPEEMRALASAAGTNWSWVRGRDTATGEEVGALYTLPGWRVTTDGRISALDRKISKHLLVTAVAPDGHRFRFLVLHLLRPMGTQAAKHAAQLEAVAEWARGVTAANPTETLLIVGDMNHALVAPGGSLFGIGREAGELNGFMPTHLTKKPFDRIVLVGSGRLVAVDILQPPYGRRPNAEEKRVWTDHFLLTALVDPS